MVAKSKRTLALLVSLVFVLSLLPMTVLAASFSDSDRHWAGEAISEWSENGVINGYTDGSFRPDDFIKRAEFAKILNSVMKYATVSDTTFSDLKTGEWYYEDVLKLNAVGVLNGSDGKVKPEDNIKRQEAFAMLRRMFNIPVDENGIKGFSDADKVDTWAVGEVGGMVAAGYVNGSNGKLNPAGNLTRAEAVTLIDNIVRGFYHLPDTYTLDAAEGIVVVNTADVVLKDGTLDGTLYVTQGVGTGDFTLENSDVAEMYITGGGENSIKLKKAKVKDLKVKVDKSTGSVRIAPDSDSSIAKATVEASNQADAILTGKIDALTIENGGSAVVDGEIGSVEAAQGSAVAITANGSVETVTVESGSTVIIAGNVTGLTIVGNGVKIVVAEGAQVKDLIVEGNGAAIEVSGTVETVTVNANGASISGEGTVETVKVESGTGNAVTTEGTKVEVSEEAGSVSTGDGSEVKPGETGTVPEQESGTPGGTPGPSDPGPSDPEPPVVKQPGGTVSSIPALKTGSLTKNSFEVDTLTGANGQTVEYALSTLNTTAPTEGWQTSAAFTGLNANTTYYVWARTQANATYNSGTAVPSAAITTLADVVGDAPIASVTIAITAPVQGAAPQTTIAEGTEYTGEITWSPAVTGTFATATVYTANVTLTAKAGYKFTDATTITVTPVSSNETFSDTQLTFSVQFPITGKVASTINFNSTDAISIVYGGTASSIAASSNNTTGAITYTIADTTVATVSATGTITSVALGETTITATVAETATCSSATTAARTINVTPKALTITGATATYIPVSTAGAGFIQLGSTATLEGVLPGDTVGLDGAGATGTIFGATSSESVTVTGYVLTGADALKYTLTQPGDIGTVDATVTSDLEPVKLTFTDNNAAKIITYGDETSFTRTASVTSLLNPSTTTSFDGAVTYSSSDTDVATVDADTGEVTIVGAGSTVITADKAVSSDSSAAEASYTLTVNKKAVTITGLTAANKEYNGNTTAVATGTATVTGILPSDSFTIIGGTAAFADKNVGDGKTVTFSGYTLSGPNSDSYEVTQNASVTANITKKVATITGLTAQSRAYNGTTTVTLNGEVVLDGMVGGDFVDIISAPVAFADKNVGDNKTVTFSGYTISGTDAANYDLKQHANVTASITKATATVGGTKALTGIEPGAAITSAQINSVVTVTGVASETFGTMTWQALTAPTATGTVTATLSSITGGTAALTNYATVTAIINVTVNAAPAPVLTDVTGTFTKDTNGTSATTFKYDNTDSKLTVNSVAYSVTDTNMQKILHALQAADTVTFKNGAIEKFTIATANNNTSYDFAGADITCAFKSNITADTSYQLELFFKNGTNFKFNEMTITLPAQNSVADAGYNARVAMQYNSSFDSYNLYVKSSALTVTGSALVYTNVNIEHHYGKVNLDLSGATVHDITFASTGDTSRTVKIPAAKAFKGKALDFYKLVSNTGTEMYTIADGTLSASQSIALGSDVNVNLSGFTSVGYYTVTAQNTVFTITTPEPEPGPATLSSLESYQAVVVDGSVTSLSANASATSISGALATEINTILSELNLATGSTTITAVEFKVSGEATDSNTVSEVKVVGSVTPTSTVSSISTLTSVSGATITGTISSLTSLKVDGGTLTGAVFGLDNGAKVETNTAITLYLGGLTVGDEVDVKLTATSATSITFVLAGDATYSNGTATVGGIEYTFDASTGITGTGGTVTYNGTTTEINVKVAEVQ